MIDILDAGARYGIHPSLQDLLPVSIFHLFEPDPDEYKYLCQKYISSNMINVSDLALSSTKSDADLNICAHAALTTLHQPDRSIYSSSSRYDQFNLENIAKVHTDTIDNLFENFL